MDEKAARDEIDRIAANSKVVPTPCGEGSMPFRLWRGAESSTPVVLVHGGSGSWTHWIANVGPLSAAHVVVTPDLPGLGDAAALPQGYTAQDAADWVRRGISRVLDDEPFHLVGFSWGATIASMVAAANERVRSLMLVGPAALGDMPRRSAMKPLIRRSRDMSPAEVLETNRENLARLMIHDRRRIDDLAAWLQTFNTNRSRFNSPQFARSSLVLEHIARSTAPLQVLYGEFDAPAWPDFETRRQRILAVRPDAGFEIVPSAGHWLQYECADEFNARCLAWLAANQ
ncbi:MAG: alpha/beta fold hydrolase [Pseudomonadales bacterium]|nr:alpha/beta fold hydrolase [Pseudomonadales bacterium]